MFIDPVEFLATLDWHPYVEGEYHAFVGLSADEDIWYGFRVNPHTGALAVCMCGARTLTKWEHIDFLCDQELKMILVK